MNLRKLFSWLQRPADVSKPHAMAAPDEAAKNKKPIKATNLPAQYRHGDVMIEMVDAIPDNRRKLPRPILAYGEITGHSHQIKEHDAVTLYETPLGLFLDVTAESATVIHEEHSDIVLKTGAYRVWRQREYSPEEIRIIQD